MDLFTLALVSHVDATPTNMNLFAFVGINNMDTACERNIDKWLAVRIHVLGRRLGAFRLVQIVCARVTVCRVIGITNRFSIQQFIQ